MDLTGVFLGLAILLCTLVAGFVFAFALIVMPGTGRLSDKDFLRSFQVMDKIIQDGHPVFFVVWIGSAISVIALVVVGALYSEGLQLVLILVASAFHFLGVQLPTAVFNIPLNNRLQTLNLEELDDSELAKERKNFEPRWVLWNNVRTVLAILSSVLLVVAILIR